jgi:hypothetical protein
MHKVQVQTSSEAHLLSKDHELIPARNVSLVAMQGSAREAMFVTIQRENISPSKKEMNKALTLTLQNSNNPMFAVRL